MLRIKYSVFGSSWDGSGASFTASGSIREFLAVVVAIERAGFEFEFSGNGENCRAEIRDMFDNFAKLDAFFDSLAAAAKAAA